MELRNLGRSGLKVSSIALGTMQFSWTADEPMSARILDAYVEAGGNFVDTADIYTTWTPGGRGGESEEIIGRWMRDRGNRDELVVATKVRLDMGGPMRQGASRRWILQGIEASLQRLQVDHVDLYQIHEFDAETPIEETLGALDDLVRRGYVRYIGASNYPAWRLVHALGTSERLGLERFVSLQPEYNLADPFRASFERELANACLHFGVGVIPYSPLAKGFLTGKYRRGQPLPDSVRASDVQHTLLNDRNFDALDAVIRVADRHGSTPARVALAWLLARPYVTAPIVGANSPEQLRDLLPAAELRLSPDDLAEIDRASDFQRARTDY